MQVLYFARRDKRCVEVVALGSNSQTFSNPETIDQISKFNAIFPAEVLQKADLMQSQKLMDWQLYLENFKNHEDFVNRLSKRGYKGLPSTLTPIIHGVHEEFKNLKAHQPRIMVQKKR